MQDFEKTLAASLEALMARLENLLLKKTRRGNSQVTIGCINRLK